MHKEGDDHGLHPVYDERDEHGRGVKEHVADERTDAAHQKGVERLKQNRRRHEAHDGDISGAFCGRMLEYIHTMVLIFCMKNPTRDGKC